MLSRYALTGAEHDGYSWVREQLEMRHSRLRARAVAYSHCPERRAPSRAIGAGLALAREGPTVQMGGSVALLLGRLFRRPVAEYKALLAAAAGAGLATAFNTPIAVAVSVL
jgi:H+/Cl- antiporter ClcA